MIDFCEVVVFSGHPEDGDVLDAGCGGRFFCTGYCGGCFEEGEERAAEEGDLLSGDYGAGSSAEFCDVG